MNKDKKYNIALTWMNDKFSPEQLEIVTLPEYPNSIFYLKEGQIVMEQDEKNNILYFDYDTIWSIFQDVFGYNYHETQLVLKDWLIQTLKLEEYTLRRNFPGRKKRLEQILKQEESTSLIVMPQKW